MTNMNMPDTPLLSLNNISKRYMVRQGLTTRARPLMAVDNVNLDLYPGETLGLVGESGCGKSTLSRLALGLEPPSQGRVLFNGQNLAGLTKKQMRGLRPQMQMVFQDPATSLNPKMTVRQILSEPFIIHRKKLDGQVEALMRAVGLSPDQADRYPHQFSGGQRQRIGIARALSLRPRLLLADEPVSALDVSIQAQILNLLLELKEEFKLTYILIAHDLDVIVHLATRCAVMYLGKIVEVLKPEMLKEAGGLHPYTEGLIFSSPSLNPGQAIKLLSGEMPSPLTPPKGCRFNTRCPLVQPICRKDEPPLKEIAPNHLCACFMR